MSSAGLAHLLFDTGRGWFQGEGLVPGGWAYTHRDTHTHARTLVSHPCHTDGSAATQGA